MRAETKIIQGVNCRKTRSIYYGMAISSTLVCLTTTLVQLWSLPRWENNDDMVKGRFLYAATFSVFAFLIMRSLCVPMPTITDKTRRKGEAKRWFLTVYCMLMMFSQSYEIHSVEFGIYLFGMVVGWFPIMQLSWPTQDIYLYHVVLIDFLSCLGGFLGFLEPLWMAVSVVAFAVLALLTYYFLVVNHKLDQPWPCCFSKASIS